MNVISIVEKRFTNAKEEETPDPLDTTNFPKVKTVAQRDSSLSSDRRDGTI